MDAGRLVLRDGPVAPGLDGGAGGDGRPPGRDEMPPLTAEELDFARKTGISPEDYQKQKAKIKATQQE